MSDFESALQAKLARNAELAAERARAEEEMDRAKERAEEVERQRLADEHTAREARHAELADHLRQLTDQLKAASTDSFIVRTGWTESHEEFIAKISTRKLTPARTLFIELDRDDDEVLVRWTTDVGNRLELWRLLEFSTGMLGDLILQIADQDQWRGASEPPEFPKGT